MHHSNEQKANQNAIKAAIDAINEAKPGENITHAVSACQRLIAEKARGSDDQIYQSIQRQLNVSLLDQITQQDLEKCKALIDAGADLTKRTDGQSLLDTAEQYPNQSITQLIQKKLNVLLLEQINGHQDLEKCKVLIDAGADIQETSLLPKLVKTAATQNNERLCMLLLEPNNDIEDDYENEIRALHYAARQNNTEMCMLLLENGANADELSTLLAEKKQDLLKILTADNPSGGGVCCIQSWMQIMQNSWGISKERKELIKMLRDEGMTSSNFKQIVQYATTTSAKTGPMAADRNARSDIRRAAVLNQIIALCTAPPVAAEASQVEAKTTPPQPPNQRPSGLSK